MNASNAIAQRIYDELQPLTYADAENGYVLLRFIEGWTESMVIIDDLVRDTDDGPGWSSAVDIGRATDMFLDFLSKFIGITFSGGETPQQKRDIINALTNLNRGSSKSSRAWVRRYLQAWDIIATNSITNPNGGDDSTTDGTTGWNARSFNNDTVTNLILNPSSEVTASFLTSSSSSSGLTASSITRTSDWAKAGSWSTRYQVSRSDGAAVSLRMGAASGTTGKVAVTQGRYYAFRAAVRVRSTSGALDHVRLQVVWLQSDAVTLSAVRSADYSSMVLNPVLGSDHDFALIMNPPSDAVYAEVRIYIDVAAGADVRADIDADAIMMTDVGTTVPPRTGAATLLSDVQDYFDGTVLGARWTGTAHASTSTLNNFARMLAPDGTRKFRMRRDNDGSGSQSVYMATNPDPAITQGQYVAVAAEMRKHANSAARNGQLSLHGNVTATIAPGSLVALTDSWQRLTIPATLSSGTDNIVELRANVIAAAEGESFFVRRIMMVIAPTAALANAGIASYFDGSTSPADPARRTRWTGTAHASTSLLEQKSNAEPYMIFHERQGGSAYRYAVRTKTSETTDVDAVRNGLKAQKPAGLILDFATIEGMTYDTIRVGYASYTASYVNRANYLEWATELPGTV